MELRPELLSSVISIVPFKIHEEKPGLYPGVFDIPEAKNNVPQILHIGECIHFVELDPERPALRIPNPSYKVAESIVNDYLQATLGVKPEEFAICGPGIFWRPGMYDLKKVIADCADELEFQKERQQRWFLSLVQMADDDWERTRQHKFITSTQRTAAKILGLERPWLITVPDSKTVQKCFACFSIVSAEAIICMNCKTILDIEQWKARKVQTVDSIVNEVGA